MRATLGTSLLFITLVSMAARCQTLPATDPPPQTARQALLEMFLGRTPDHLERHLPEVAKKGFRQIGASGSDNLMAEIRMIGAQATAAGSHVQIMETGPVLLVNEEPSQGEKLEVTVERDSLMGNEDQIDLTFRYYKNGKEQALPVVPRLSFDMTSEANVWRLNDINLSVHVPLGDADFVKSFVKDLLEKQRAQNELRASYTVRAIVQAEVAHHAAHPDQSFICSLSELKKASREADPEGPIMIGDEVGSGAASGYVFAMSGCTNARFQIAAEPATSESGKRSFCADESGKIRASKDGKALSCLSKGEELELGNFIPNHP